MKTSELIKFTSGCFTLSHVIREFVEIFEEFPNWWNMWEEVNDTYTTGCLYLFCKWKIDMPLPSILSSAHKYISRLERCKEILIEHNLFDETREEWYFSAYTVKGSNLVKKEKLEAFLEEARKDWRS